MTVTVHTDLIYRSQNGDTWLLLREAPSARILVRHTANKGSGGKVTDLPVEEFLSINGAGPEHSALRTLLTKLAQAD